MMSSEKRLRRLFWALLGVMLLMGCGKVYVDPLADTWWALVSLNGQDLIAGSRITLKFAEGSVSGSGGCNTYTAMDRAGAHTTTYTAKADGTLTLPGFMITEMGCTTPAGVLQQEQQYMEALGKVATYRIVGDRLEIGNATGTTILVFEKE